MKWLGANRSLKGYILVGFAAFMVYYACMYFLVSPNLSYEQLIIPNIFRGFGMAVLFIGIWLYALSNLSLDATLAVAAVLIITRTMIGPGVWGFIFNYLDSIWNLEALTNLTSKMDASAYSKQTAMKMLRAVNLDALMIATKRIYGILIMVGSAALVYVSLLNFDGLGKRKLILLRKRLKGQSTEHYQREAITTEESKAEVEAASAVAIV